ncbi:hypothetical protein Q3G72_033031 [Acer saccharum]|nr:hypothetical protein Q3G72_033031 [Acer saccharum]
MKWDDFGDGSGFDERGVATVRGASTTKSWTPYEIYGRTSNEMYTDEPFDFEATGVNTPRRADSQQASMGHIDATAQSGTATVGHRYTTPQDIVVASHIETTQ